MIISIENIEEPTKKLSQLSEFSEVALYMVNM